MTDQWHLARDGQTYGPYSWAELSAYAQAGSVAPGDLLWSPTTGGWVRAEQLQGLFSTPAPASSTPPAVDWTPQPGSVTSAPAAAQASVTPRSKRGGLWFAVTLLAVLAVAGGAAWFFWLRDGDTRGQQASSPGPVASFPTVTPSSSEAFWQSPELEASIAAMDDGDWRNYPDLAAEQAAISEVLGGFGVAMKAGDLEAAVSYILPEQQAAYRELFAANPDGMASFGDLLPDAEMSFLSDHSDTSAYNRTAEYALELDGFTFYLVFIKTADGWMLYDF